MVPERPNTGSIPFKIWPSSPRDEMVHEITIEIKITSHRMVASCDNKATGITSPWTKGKDAKQRFGFNRDEIFLRDDVRYETM